MQTNRGISLITVLVILAILAVVAAFAFPAWHARVAREHIEEAIKAADAPKLVVMEAATTHGGLAHVSKDDLAYNPGSANEYVEKLEVGDGGRITLTTRNTGIEPAPVLVFLPEEPGKDDAGRPISWSCTMVVGAQSSAPPACAGAVQAPKAVPLPAAPAPAATSAR
ncbi:pilin [Rhodanobacter ginsengiterrae]|uniref:pilin n=1 Tax=Rhodanobacter ginsengiterrae TaxID=2008451 RepID=UPI003CFACE26